MTDPSLRISTKQQFLGFVVGIYSVGQFIGSLVFGSWSNRRKTLEPLVVSLLFLVIANAYYGFAQDFPQGGVPRQWHVFIARFFVGFGAGNVALARAFVSEASTMENRNMAMTITGAAQGLGFVLGPAIGFCFTFMPSIWAGPIAINQYTSAGFCSALFGIVNLVLIPIMFRDISHKSAQGAARIKAPPMTRDELINMSLVMWIFFIILTAFSVFETITGPLTELFFAWDGKKNGLLIFGAGVFSVFVFFGLGIVSKKAKIDDRVLILFGCVCLFVSNLFMIPYWGSMGLYLWQLIIGSLWVGIGYPIASSITYALFSKVIHPVAQGDKMGYLTAGGSLARMVGPVWATALFDLSPVPSLSCITPANKTLGWNYTADCPRHPTEMFKYNLTGQTHYDFGVAGYPGAWMFLVLSFLLLVTSIVIVVAWKRLVPHPESGKLGLLNRAAEANENSGTETQIN